MIPSIIGIHWGKKYLFPSEKKSETSETNTSFSGWNQLQEVPALVKPEEKKEPPYNVVSSVYLLINVINFTFSYEFRHPLLDFALTFVIVCNLNKFIAFQRFKLN